MADNEKNPDAAQEENNTDRKDQNDTQNKERKRPGKKPLIILGVVVVVMVIVALVWWLMTRNQETTDDAFTEGDAVTVAPKVAGYVTELRVKDNQRVKRGDLLVLIDPRDATAQRDQAQAQLALSKVQYPSQRDEAQAQVLKAKADLANAEAAYRRQRGVDPRATTQQNIDSANAQLRSAQAQLASANAQLEVASQINLQIRQQETNVEAREQQVEQARAQLETANPNLSYTEVRAPFDGFVTKRNVQTGTLVQAGTALFSLVSPDIWVVANFKESQLERMRPGNKVSIGVDAYPWSRR